PVGKTITTRKARYGMSAKTGCPAKAGSYNPNKYGIYDLAGNAAEWVSGVLSAYPGNKGLMLGRNRISRGGSWSSEEKELTAYSRKSLNISNSTGSIGFRCAIDHDVVMRRENK
ncbi:MAG: SUMF1/EgtB/PvdO family nonheme iron enzyme, partial [Candidatus Delongbacteria bacterium]|nr:SUMF1/EgtB/PvdO family nonheme iron enzyme [Candidatus Delongbacteria bacterium]